MTKTWIKVVTIGGGGGHAQILSSIKSLQHLDITAIVPVTDSGGSTGVLNSEYGISKCTGDLTKCMAALSDSELLREGLLYRYNRGSLNNHSVKNLIFAGLQLSYDLEISLSLMHRICGLRPWHKVYPVAKKNSTLMVRVKTGKRIVEETAIDLIARNPLWQPDLHAISSIWMKPQVSAAPEVLAAVKAADFIVICPGDLFTSIIPVLLPKGMRHAFAESRAKIVGMINIMTKLGETDGFMLQDFVCQLESRLGRNFDYLLCNGASIPKKILNLYGVEHKVAVVPLCPQSQLKAKLVVADLLGMQGNLVRHDPAKCRRALRRIFESKI